MGGWDRDLHLAEQVKNRLRILRAELAWSQAELAQRLGVSRQTVNAIETGKYDPSLPLAFSLARMFKRQIEEIFEAEPGLPTSWGGRPRPKGAAGWGSQP